MFNNFVKAQLLRFTPEVDDVNNDVISKWEEAGDIIVEFATTAATNSTINDTLTVMYYVTAITANEVKPEDKIKYGENTYVCRTAQKARRYNVLTLELEKASY